MKHFVVLHPINPAGRNDVVQSDWSNKLHVDPLDESDQTLI